MCSVHGVPAYCCYYGQKHKNKNINSNDASNNKNNKNNSNRQNY